jgi:hypothetical protein
VCRPRAALSPGVDLRIPPSALGRNFLALGLSSSALGRRHALTWRQGGKVLTWVAKVLTWPQVRVGKF